MVSRINNKSHQCGSAAGYDHDPLPTTAHAMMRRTRSGHRRPGCSPDDHPRRLRRTTCVEIPANGLKIFDLACRRSGRSSRPGQVEQHHELFALDNPVSQQSLTSTKGYRPATIAKATQAKDHAGLGRIHPKDGDDASDRADQHGWCAAKPLADLLGDQDLVGGYGPSSRDLIPGHDLGAITLADALDQGPPLGKLLGRGRRRGRCPLMPTAYWPSRLVPSSLRTISE